jgi:hypothetical protein
MILAMPGRLALTLVTVLAAGVLGGSVGVGQAGAASNAGSTNGDLTISNNDLRTGWDAAEPELGPDNVSASNFGQLFSTQVQGQVYAQPLVVNRTASSPGTLIVPTENDNVYGLDPVDGARKWVTSVGTPWSASVLGCGDLTPNLGVTSTPVYDPSTNTVYVMAKSAPDGTDSADPQWYLHALNAETGFERAGWPVAIGGHPDNDPSRTFNEETAAQRPGLLLLDGVVYAGFASYCDHGPYDGYVVGVSTTTAKQTAMFSMEVGTSSGEGGVWHSGGGLVSDGTGQIIVTTGNGDTAPVAPSNAPPAALSEAVVRLGVQPDGTLKATDWFSPSNGATLNQFDSDLGSGGPMAIPDGYGTAADPHLLVQVGKDGRVFLLNRDSLGGDGQGPNGGDDVLGTTPLSHGVWGHPAFWGGTPGTDSAGGYVYLVENAGYLRALKLGVNGSGVPQLISTANSQSTFGYTSGSPIVTSDGDAAGTALVWLVSVDGAGGNHPALHAFNAEPDNGVLDQVYTAPLNPPGVTDGSLAHGAKFTTVATDDGRVFVGTRDGDIFGFGHPSTAPIYAPRTDVGPVPVGTTSAPVDVTLTASRPVTVTGISTSPPFAVTDAPTSPVSLATGDTLTVHVTLHPTGPGDQPGTLTVATSESSVAGSVSFGIDGYGTQAGLVSFPPSVSFGSVPLPGHDTQGINVVNTSGTDETISSVSSLSPPYSSTDLPTVGQLVPAGASLAVPLAYSPTTQSPSDTEQLSIGVNNDAEVLTVDLSGSAVTGHSKLILKPAALNFGLVPRGITETKTFKIRNNGNIFLTINKAKAPFGAFATTTPVSEGQQIFPDQSVIQSVTFSPTAKGTTKAAYQITGDDGSGVHNETLTGTDDQLTDRYLRSRSLIHLLGPPTGPTRAFAHGFTRAFVKGGMFWSSRSGIHEVHGAILRRFAAIGGVGGHAGFPTTDVTPISPAGLRSRFHGSWAIYWSRQTGAWPVHGRIATRWRHLGAQQSTLGYPLSGQTTIKSGGVRQVFQHGTIRWTHHGGYRVTHS